ncbi:hypothetical protein EDM56_25930 [Brevibacillus fluminis]|uniref:SMP-30/Gluconolactonase/LRE-like region domain-containing protein n=1 Tax=Brevibacillus fluminis TaxID=511487 RepID=A0A3M8D1U9_9BACL|nr:SMP-30/gluconolactonase/LRE family protein [Brevibacillus fluminis]RNB81165.1 hypothetical protein EDM56_25930 [Brevibacillus fluminis]
MRKKTIGSYAAVLCATFLLSACSVVSDVAPKPAPSLSAVTEPHATILTDLDPAKSTGMRVEGLIGDTKGRLYTSDMDSRHLMRVLPDSGRVEVLTTLPRPATGMAFDQSGNLYLASGGSQGEAGVIFKVSAKALEQGAFDPSKVETFATGTNGANGLAFDAKGNLYVSGAATGNIYVVSPDGKMRTWVSGIHAERKTQPIVVNGLAFDREGRLYMANTSSGEINRVAIGDDGTFGQVKRFAKDQRLYGADGIAFGPDGDLYACANERNSVVKVDAHGKVTPVWENANAGVLEFPASLHFIGNTLYVSNYDQPRGVNKANEAGIGASIAKIELPAQS